MSELLTKEDKRIKYCGEFRESDIGQKVCVMGWVQRARDLGSLIFIDLRDRSGIVQLAFDRKHPKGRVRPRFCRPLGVRSLRKGKRKDAFFRERYHPDREGRDRR